MFTVNGESVEQMNYDRSELFVTNLNLSESYKNTEFTHISIVIIHIIVLVTKFNEYSEDLRNVRLVIQP